MLSAFFIILVFVCGSVGRLKMNGSPKTPKHFWASGAVRLHFKDPDRKKK